MPYLLVDDCMDTHPKIETLSDRAYRLHMAGLQHCARNLTDGLVSETTVRGLKARLRTQQKHFDELVDAGLWAPYRNGNYVIPNYLDWNPSKHDVERKRSDRAAAGRLGGLRSGESRRAHCEASASKQMLEQVLEPQPIPSLKGQVLLGLGRSVETVENLEGSAA